MTTVNNNTQAGAAGSASSILGNGDVSSMFTTLLVAQIKNQDPLSPSDPSQMINQLTQLSQMEALQGLSQQGSANAGLLSSLQTLALGGQVGSRVQVQTDQLQLNGEAIETRFTLPTGSGVSSLVLTGADGREQRFALDATAAAAGAYRLDPAKLGLGDGHYQLRLETGSGLKLPVGIVAEVTAVRLGNGGEAVLQLGGLGEFYPGSITHFLGKAPIQS
ncbi:MAG TPA: flagellar hook capping FlgD N-terminal domain-containing protein [Roseateles sp.]